LIKKKCPVFIYMYKTNVHVYVSLYLPCIPTQNLDTKKIELVARFVMLKKLH